MFKYESPSFIAGMAMTLFLFALPMIGWWIHSRTRSPYVIKVCIALYFGVFGIATLGETYVMVVTPRECHQREKTKLVIEDCFCKCGVRPLSVVVPAAMAGSTAQ